MSKTPVVIEVVSEPPVGGNLFGFASTKPCGKENGDVFIPSKQLRRMFELAEEEVDEGSIEGKYFLVTLGDNARGKVPHAVVEVIGLAEGFETAASAAASTASASPSAGKKAPAPEWRAVREAVDVVVAAVEAAGPQVDSREVARRLLEEEDCPDPETSEFAAETKTRVEAAEAEKHRLAVEAVARALGDEDLHALIVQEAMKAVSPPELSLVPDEAAG